MILGCLFPAEFRRKFPGSRNLRATGFRNRNPRVGFHLPVDSHSLRVDSLSRVEKDKEIYPNRVDTIRSLLAHQRIPDNSLAPGERVIEAVISNLRCLLATVRCGICPLGSAVTGCLRTFMISKTHIISRISHQLSRHLLRADQLHSRCQSRDQCRDQCRDRDRVVRVKDEADLLPVAQ